MSPREDVRNLRICSLALAAFALAGVLGSPQSLAQNAHIANALSNNVSVIDTQTNTVIGSPIAVGNFPWGVAVSPDGRKVYVTVINGTERTSGVGGGVAVIDTRTNTVNATFPTGNDPTGIAVSPDGGRLYVANDNFPVSTVTVIDAATGATVAAIPTANENTNSIATTGVVVSPDGKEVYALNTGSDAIRVIDTATNAIIMTITTPGIFNAYQAAFSPDGTRAYVSQTRLGVPSAPVLTVVDVANSAVADIVVLGSTDGAGGALAEGVAISPDGKKIYAVNLLFSAGQTYFSSQVSVVDTATDAIVAMISAGASAGMSITPDGAKLYAVDTDANSVTVVDTATNATTAVIPVGNFPISAGNFIQPAPRFAGTPGKANCFGQSVAALARQYRGLNAAAATLGYSSVQALQASVVNFCEA